MLDKLQDIDEALTLTINGVHCTLTDNIWIFFSDKKVWVPLYILVLIFLIWRVGWKKALIAIAGIALTILACDQFGNLVKDSVARLRPCYNSEMLHGGLRMLEGRGQNFGFFSAHAADSFGLAVCLFFSMKSLDKVHGNEGYLSAIFLWASLVSISRIFVGKHYFGDVATGILFGCLFGYLCAQAIIFATKRLCN